MFGGNLRFGDDDLSAGCFDLIKHLLDIRVGVQVNQGTDFGGRFIEIRQSKSAAYTGHGILDGEHSHLNMWSIQRNHVNAEDSFVELLGPGEIG